MTRALPGGTVTFVFTDVEGSTRLLRELGAERYAEVLSEHRRILRDAYSAHGGVEVDTQGDAFFFAFPTAQGALDAAHQGQQALAAGPIRVRVGLHTGTARLTDEGYVGEDVHKGARIGAAGHGGQVLLSKETRELVDGRLTDLGEHRLKDLTEAVWIFQLGSERFPPLKTISNTNLPRPASSFVGREREVAEVVAIFRDGTRLLTLAGSGGSGKTRLAIEAATTLVPEFRNGVFWVGLAPLRDPALVIDTIAVTLGAKEGLAEHIGEREMLLVLDNLEQVVGCAPELASLLEGCPNLRLLVSSRELLRVRGEVEYAVPPLAEPEAVTLFCERARLEPDATVAELCARLDDLPLAVELAAARTRALSPAQILERITHRLDLFEGGRDADPRQRTLRATIGWSYDLLTPEEQQLFFRLSAFSGGCTLEAAEEVAAADLNTLQSLVEKSLLRFTNERYWMLETIRAFAIERLEDSGGAQDMRRRHASWFLAIANASRRGLRGPEQSRWLELMRADEDNFRAALSGAIDHEDAELACLLIAALEVFWVRAYRHSEAERWVNAALAVEGPVEPALRARALATGGLFAGSMDVARSRLDQAIPILRTHDDLEGLAFALRASSWVRSQQGELAEARAALEEALELFRRLGHTVTTRLIDLGQIARAEGDLPSARARYEEALTTGRAEGDLHGAAGACEELGELALAIDDADDAERWFSESLRIYRELDASWTTGSVRGLARVAIRRGELERAGTLWGAAEVLEGIAGGRALLDGEAPEAQLDELPDDARADFDHARERAQGVSFAQTVEVISRL